MFSTMFVSLMLAQAEPAGTPIAGVVRDAAGRPAEKAEVVLSGIGYFTGSMPILARGTTDAEGGFRLTIPPDKDGRRSREALTLWAIRPGSAVAALGFNRDKPPKEGSITLTLAVPAEAAVTVVGPDGKPVAGARVQPYMIRLEGLPYSLALPRALGEALAAETDARGKGRLAAFSAEAKIDFVRVIAKPFGIQLVEFGDGKVELAPVGRVAGRVVADEPAQAKGLAIIASTLPEPPAPHRPGIVEVTTDADGRFEIPAIAAGKLTLHAAPAEAGAVPRTLYPADRVVKAGELTEVEVRLDGPVRTRAVAGRVRDREGRPVAGATVFQSGDGPRRTRTTSDEQGRFRLDGVKVGKAFLFAEKDGFRFLGRPIDEKADAIELVLTRADEPSRETLKTLDPPRTHEEELALARRVLDPYADRALKEGGEPARIRALEALARVEPARALELIETKALSPPILGDMIRMRVVEGLLRESPEEAMEVVGSMREPFARAFAYILASGPAVVPDRAKAADRLTEALVHARNVQDPGQRLVCLGQVAEHWLDMGRVEPAKALLREGEKVAKEMPKAAWAGYARAAFAEELAQVDPKAALALIEGLSDTYESDRHHGNIAHELAARDPAEAERVLGMVNRHKPPQRDYAALRVCYRMAPVDRARARRIADSIDDPISRAYAIGLMAQAHAGRDKPAAASLLADAFARLTKAVDEGRDPLDGLHGAAVTAATLLPAAEAIDPALVPGYLWRSLSLRRPIPADQRLEGVAAQEDADLAMRLARYDRDVARLLIEPLAARARTAAAKEPGFPARDIVVAAATVDPRWAVEIAEALPEPPDLMPNQPKHDARLKLAQALARRGEDRWKYLQWHFLHHWVPDVEDIVPDF
jgi:hypothetical protein